MEARRPLPVGRVVYDTPRAALVELTDYEWFESVAIQVLRVEHPELRITAPTADLGRDAYGRRLFGERDEIVGLFSCETTWHDKLNRDLKPYGQCPTEDKPDTVFFVTNQRITDHRKKKIGQEVYDRYQIQLEIVALDELDLALKSDALHRVAEHELGVRPRQPRVLQPPAAFWDAQQISQPGREAPLVGRDDELRRLRTALAPAAGSSRSRFVVVEGPGGIGKTRLVVEAGRAITTLIARTGIALSADALVDVPVDVPSVIVVDDAHRSPDLTGLAAMVGDPRFARVTVVLTVRPGLAEPTLRQVGLDRVTPTTITLEPLGRSEINQIVAGHGITDETFHLHVIDIAHGNPLIAHTACEIAAQGTYSWQDTASVLRDLFKIRLSHLTTDGHEHLAVAVALAVLTTVQDSGQLTALTKAVHGLTADSQRLHEILMDLVDAGIVGGPPYTLRPDALGPVIVADALADGRRVWVDLTRMLRVLGRAACWGSGAGEDSDESGLLGIGPPRPAAGGALAGVHATVLASQLGVLAQAAHLTGRDADLRTLSRAVLQLLSGQTDTTAWLDVLVLANAIGPYHPPLLGELRDELVRRWPPRPGQNLWGDDPVTYYRREVERVLEQAASLAQRVGRLDQRRAVSWILECTWLAYPVVSSVKLDSLRQTITSLISANPRADRTWDAVFARRDEVLRSVLLWGKDRFAESPAALGETERAVRGPGETAHVVLAAVRPFLSVVLETHAVGTPQDPHILLVGQHVLPDDPRTDSQLRSAVDAVRWILDKINLASPEAQPVLREIAVLPRELRAEGARAGTTGPVPAYAVEALHSAAGALADAVAERWAALPLGVRHSAAASAVRPAGRRPTTLAALAEGGDAVAVAAVGDTELGRVLVLFPIGEDLDRIARGGTDATNLDDRRRREAEELGEQLPFEEAIELLESLDEPPSGLFGPDCLGSFASAVGRRAPTADVVLTRLTAGPLVGEYALLADLSQSEPDAVLAWILGNVTVPRIGVLGLAIVGELPEDRETVILDAVAASLPTATASTELTALADALARYLARSCRRPVIDRLERLAALGETAPAAALPRVLSMVGLVLRPPRTQVAVTVAHPDLRRRLVAVLGRALAATDHDMLSGVQYDTAMGGLALAIVAPAEVAELLIERVLADLPQVMPMEWRRLLADMDFAERTPVAEAFRVRAEQQRTAGTLTAREDTAYRVLTQLGGGTEPWVILVRELADGSPADRDRAAQIVRFSWHHAVWTEIVPDLLDAGLDEHTISQLYEGLLVDNVDYDLDEGMQARLDVLQPLLDDIRPAVREFADEATQRLNSLPGL